MNTKRSDSMFSKIVKQVIIQLFLLIGFLWFNSAYGENYEKQNIKSNYYLQPHAFVNNSHFILNDFKRDVTTNNQFFRQTSTHKTLANSLKKKVLHNLVSLKKNAKNSNSVHSKYTFSNDFSVMHTKIGFLFSKIISSKQVTGSTGVLVVKMLLDSKAVEGKLITFSLTDSKHNPKPNAITYSCVPTNCNTNSAGVVQLTITNNVGGGVIVIAKAPDDTLQQYLVSFDDKYIRGTINNLAPPNVKNKPADINVLIHKNGELTPGVAVSWKFVDPLPIDAWITPTSYTTAQGIATAYISNPNGHDVKVTATTPDSNATDPTTISFLKYTFDQYFFYNNSVDVSAASPLVGKPISISVTLGAGEGMSLSGKKVLWECGDDNLKIVTTDNNGATTEIDHMTLPISNNGVNSIQVIAKTGGEHKITASLVLSPSDDNLAQIVSIEKEIQFSASNKIYIISHNADDSDEASFEVQLCDLNQADGKFTCSSAFASGTTTENVPTSLNISADNNTRIAVDQKKSRIYFYMKSGAAVLCTINATTAKLEDCKSTAFKSPGFVDGFTSTPIVDSDNKMIYMNSTGIDACSIKDDGTASDSDCTTTTQYNDDNNNKVDFLNTNMYPYYQQGKLARIYITDRTGSIINCTVPTTQSESLNCNLVMQPDPKYRADNSNYVPWIKIFVDSESKKLYFFYLWYINNEHKFVINATKYKINDSDGMLQKSDTMKLNKSTDKHVLVLDPLSIVPSATHDGLYYWIIDKTNASFDNEIYEFMIAENAHQINGRNVSATDTTKWENLKIHGFAMIKWPLN